MEFTIIIHCTIKPLIRVLNVICGILIKELKKLNF